MAQESLEQTQRRLGLSTAPVTNERTTRQYSPTPAPPTPPVNARGAFRIAVALAVVIAAIVVGVNVFESVAQQRAVDDQWAAYPGAYFIESDDVLASDSLEETRSKGEALITELQGELAAYGFEWSVEYEGDVSATSNGYGGDSMLYDYSGDTIIGESSVTDPAARENIIRIFGELLAARDGSTIVIDNDEVDGDDAVTQFGSADRDAQAAWSAWSYSEQFSSLQGDIGVFDATVPTDEQFGGDYWVPDEATGSLFVRLHVTAYYLLSEDDRAAFIAALEPFEGQVKPPYRG